MPRRAPNYLWRKRATPEWLDEHEAELDFASGGTYSVVERPAAEQRQIEMFCKNAALAGKLKSAFGGTIEQLPADWHARFLAASQMRPLRIGRRLVVVAEARDVTSAASLLIPAGAAFGTGDHATTAMSLRMLERVSRGFRGGWRMLDAGTGSGILALAGKRFDAGPVLAIDNDPTAISTARENGRANGIRQVKFAVGDVTTMATGEFDIITANLYSEILEQVLPLFRTSLVVDGRMILSGVMRQQEATLTKALRANRFRVLEARRRGKWVALLCRGL